MKKFSLILVVLVVGLAFVGCSTTTSITYTHSVQPRGIYKYAVISATSFSNSVLQRFYAQYPSDQYEVIAYETKRNQFLPVLTGIGGAFFGALLPGGGNNERLIGAGAGAVLGYSLTYAFSQQYVVTYIER